MRLARQGKLLTHHTDRSVLTLMTMDKMLDRSYTPVHPDMDMGKLIQVISGSYTDYVPVLNDSGVLVGEIDIVKIRHVLFRTELYHRFIVSQLMTPPLATLGVNDPMKDVMKVFEKTGAIALPVVDVNNCLVGYISRVKLFDNYRKLVADYSTE